MGGFFVMDLFGGLFDVDGNGFVTPEEELYALDSIEHIYRQGIIDEDDDDDEQKKDVDW